MTDFSRIQNLNGAHIIEAHEFPLFQFTALYQKFTVPSERISAESIIVPLEVIDISHEELLNLIIASGYVADDADITFRTNEASGYFYAYFNFINEAL